MEDFNFKNLVEGPNIELKERGNIHCAIPICSFLNTDGGVLIVGYSERQGNLVGIGPQDMVAILRAVDTVIPDAHDYITIENRQIEGKDICFVFVKKSTGLHRVAKLGNGDQPYYIRIGSANVRCDLPRATYYHSLPWKGGINSNGNDPSKIDLIKNYEPSDAEEKKSYRELLADYECSFEQIGALPNTNHLFKYMSLDTALISLGKTPASGTLRFVEPTKWEDRYEGRFYNAKYVNTSGSLKGVIPDPVMYACCFTTKQDNEAAWKIYTYGKTGLGSVCVEFKINRKKMRRALINAKTKKCNLFVGQVKYLPQVRMDNLHREKIQQGGGKVLNSDYSRYFKGFSVYNYICLLLLKRDAFKHEEEIRYFVQPDGMKVKSYVNTKGMYKAKNPPLDVSLNWLQLLEEVRIDSKCSDIEYDLLADTINRLIDADLSVVDKTQLKQQLKPIRYNVYGEPVKIKVDIP